MKSVADFICKNRYLIIIISIILLILSFIGMNLTKINYDILIYLPDDIETIQGQNILTNDFNIGSYSIATAENMTSKDILLLEEQIKKIDGVADVMSIYDAIGSGIPIEMLPSEIRDKIHKDNTDIIFITFKESTSNEKTIEAVKEIRTITEGKILQGGMSSLVLDTMELSKKEIVIYVVIAVILCILVLQLSLDSYAVPFILLSNIGCAIVFNLGTNIFLGQISYITKALVAVLQLGVTTDFSIFLYHSYEEKKYQYHTKEEAMSESIKDTFLSVTGSSLTTIVGFLALCAMRLTLGRDLGIVMAKGVLLGVLTVLTLFPSLLLVFDNLIKKTKHRDVMPKFNKFNKFIVKNYKIIFVIFLLLLIPTYLANKKVMVYYKLDTSLPNTLESVKTNNILKEKYDIVSPEIILINKNLKNDSAMSMINEIKSLDGIDFVLSFRELEEHGITKDILPTNLLTTFESDKYELILVNSIYDVATDELNNQVDTLNKIVKSYDEKAIVAGVGPLTKDLVETYDTDYNNVNIFSIGCIFIVLLFVLKSFTLPILLIITIEAAILTNLSISYFNGTVLPFIAPITLGTIQLGATIDYAILVTTNYISKRKEGVNKEKAIIATMNYAAPSILISGMCFFAATFGVGIYSDIEMIGSICTLISRGALISVLMVLTVLPSILLIFDPLIFRNKRKNKESERMKKIMKFSQKMTLWLLLIGITLTILPINALALEKNESVYTKLNYDGTVQNIIVNEQIINNDKLDKIEDYTELKDILNIQNDAKYTLDNNKITWDASGNDIFYKGTTDKQLPIDLKITYTLDGKEYKAEDMLGKSGHVTIKLQYINNDKHGSLYTPFVVTLGTIIDGENNRNITIVNGKVVNNGSNYVAIGIATPGLYQSLGFEELKTMDTITISYDTTKFELASMYSIVSSKLIDANDLSIFDKMDSLYQDINTLQDSMDQIDDGAKKLSLGVNTLYTNYYQFNNGLDTFRTNFYTLNSGVSELQTEVNNILNNDKVKEFRNYLPVLEEDAKKIKEITNNHSQDINNFINISNGVVDDVTEDILNIIAYLETVSKYLDNTDEYNMMVANYTDNLNNSIDQIASFIDIIQNYLDTINELSSFTSSSAAYIIKTYEANPEAASLELINLYYEAMQIKNSNITNSLNDDIYNLNGLKINLANAKTKLNSVSAQLLENDSVLIGEIDSVRKSSVNLQEAATKVKNTNENIHTNIDKINTGIDIINELPDKINEISTGIDKFEEGINAISDGTNQLYEGMTVLTEYSNQIYDGMGILDNGANELSEGISKFNKEGINKITELVNSDVKSTINKTRELIKLGNNYSSFAGSNSDKTNTTKFIMLIDSLEVPSKKVTTEETKKTTFWDRIKKIFS